MLRWSAVLAGFLALALWGVGTASASYYLTNLGALPTGAGSDATSINAKGQVAGYSDINSNTTGGSQAFLWTGGNMDNLGASPDGSVTMTFGWGLNDSGAVVGSTYAGVGVVYNNGTWTQLPGTSTAYAINDAGTIVGEDVPAASASWAPPAERSLHRTVPGVRHQPERRHRRRHRIGAPRRR